MRNVEEHRSEHSLKELRSLLRLYECISLSSRLLPSPHLMSLLSRENKWDIKAMCDFSFACWINVEYDYHIEDWMCVIDAGCKGNYSDKICSRRVMWLHLHYGLWFLSSGRLYTPNLSLFLFFCMSGFVKGVFHSKKFSSAVISSPSFCSKPVLPASA